MFLSLTWAGEENTIWLEPGQGDHFCPRLSYRDFTCVTATQAEGQHRIKSLETEVNCVAWSPSSKKNSATLALFLLFFHLPINWNNSALFLKINFSWSIVLFSVALISLFSRTNHPWTYIHPLPFGRPPRSGRQSAWSRVPCAICYLLNSCLFCVRYQ